MKSYRYIKVGSFYFTLEQDGLALARLLYSRGRPFVPDGKLRHRLLRPFAGAIRLYRVLRFVLPYLKARYGGKRQPDHTLHLPVSGQVVFPLRTGGYKAFDLQRNAVVTLFPSEADAAVVEKAIGRKRKIGRQDFAPTLRQWRVEERWCEEDYINGSKAPSVTKDWRVFDTILKPLIEALILAEPPQRVALHAYVEAQQNPFTEEAEVRSASWFDEAKVTRVRDFVGRMSERICRSATGEIGLSLSHGDLGAQNVLICSNRSFIIDWDTAGYRSALHDAYFVFLMTLNRKNPPEPALLAAKLNQALAQLRAAVTEAHPDVAAVLFPPTVPEEVLRWLFYIEHVHVLVVELLQTADGFVAYHRLEKLLRHLDSFERFEASSVGDNTTPDIPHPLRKICEFPLPRP